MCLTGLCSSPRAFAQAGAEAEPARVRVRIRLSEGAAKRLSALRVRRLLRLEIDDIADIDASHVGTLEGDDLIRVWIDVPIERRAVVEVRRVDGSFARRALAIGGFPSDVAADVVILATAEMVRFQASMKDEPAPAPTPKAPPPAPSAGTFAASAGAAGLLLPTGTPVFWLGPELAVELRHDVFAHRLYGRWQIGVDALPSRWLEIGVGADFRLNLTDSSRIHLGVKGGFVDLALPSAALIDGQPSTHAWTVRMAGEIGFEAHIAKSTWMFLGIEPGAALRPIDVTYADGSTSALDGFALGINLGLTASPFETP